MHEPLPIPQLTLDCFRAAWQQGHINRRIAWQHFALLQADLYHVGYVCKPKKYEAWIVGKSLLIVADKTPAADFVSDSIEEMLDLWNRGYASDAALIFRKLDRLAKRDNNTRLILSNAKTRLPSALSWYAWGTGFFSK
ncbi:MAG: hypothetical protein K8R36_14255 [Planctomycetales bacterium]|nr:hypothetical protein [Planctomycetales bacterium]